MATQGSWSLVARAEHYRRYGASGALVGDGRHLYLFGGCSEDGAFSRDLVCLDLTTGSGHVAPDVTPPEGRPFARHFHSCVETDGFLYMFGGKSNGYHSDVFRYHITDNFWKFVKPSHSLTQGKLFARFGQTAVLWQGCMYIFGGYDQHGFCCDGLHAFDFERNSWFQELRTAGKVRERYHHSAVVHGRCMYLFGGRSDNDSLGDLVEYHFDSRSWTTMTTTGRVPSARWGHSACVIGDCMYVFGGCDGTSCFGDLFEYNFLARRWAQVDTPHTPAPRYFQMMTVHAPDRLCVIGGKDLRGRCFDEVHEFHLVFGATALSPSGSLTSSQVLTLSSDAKLRLKLLFDEEIRVLTVARSLTFQDLLIRLREEYTVTVSFRYKDEDGDLITVRSEDDWAEAVACFENSKGPAKVYLDATGSRPGSGISLRPSPRLTAAPTVDSLSPTSSRSPSLARASSSSSHLSCATMPAQWQLGEPIGSGAFGQVYKVLNSETGELFAMKQVRINQSSSNKKIRSVVDSLMHEIEMMQELQHPNIVRYMGSETRDEKLCIFMEFVSGGSIASMLQKFGPFPEKVTCSFTKQILDGLVYLHGKLLIHRDLKGANILLTPDGVVKLADFGASKKLQDIRTATDNNAAGTMTGTPYWMAPEVIRGNVNYGRKADIWSAGICVIEMATGRPPYSELGPVTALFKIGSTDQAPPFPDSLSEPATNFLAMCLNRDPKLRPAAEELTEHQWIVDYRNARQSMIAVSTPVIAAPECAQNSIGDSTIVEYLELSRSTDATSDSSGSAMSSLNKTN